MKKEDIKDDTQVTKIDAAAVNDLLDINSTIAMLPEEKKPKPSVFEKKTGVDLTFLDKPDDDDPPADPQDPPADPSDDPPADPPADPPQDPPQDPPADTNTMLKQPGGDDDPANSDDKNKGGRPTAMVSALKSLTEKKVILPFDDDKKLEDYTALDLEEVIVANIEKIKEDTEKEMPQRFFQNMPPEMQQAYSYIAEGGQDLKGLFQAMGASHEMRDIDVSTEGGQIYAVRNYLQATNYGTPEEIEEEIVTLQDRGELEKKANQFKPKLDAMSQQLVNQRLETQRQANEKRQKASQQYMESVYNTLNKAELNGTKLDSRTQELLYSGLVQPNYPSITGKQTNLLGHLLEKYQWVEPNHELIAEVMWLLADSEGYRESLKKAGATSATEETVRKLKASQETLANSSAQDDLEANPPTKRGTVTRPKKGFFARQ